MVTLNLTLAVQLGLFLIFLWGTNTLFFRPILSHMDHREEQIEQSRTNAEADDKTTAKLEVSYAQEMGAIRRAADDEFRDNRRAALEAHAAALSEQRHRADETVAKIREEALQQVESERGAYERLAPGVADLIAERLGMRGGSA